MMIITAIALTAILEGPEAAQMRMRGDHGGGQYYAADF